MSKCNHSQIEIIFESQQDYYASKTICLLCQHNSSDYNDIFWRNNSQLFIRRVFGKSMLEEYFQTREDLSGKRFFGEHIKIDYDKL